MKLLVIVFTIAISAIGVDFFSREAPDEGSDYGTEMSVGAPTSATISFKNDLSWEPLMIERSVPYYLHIMTEKYPRIVLPASYNCAFDDQTDLTLSGHMVCNREWVTQ